jgi:hypothetical protein
MAYSDAELAQAGRQLAESLRNLHSRVEAVEAKPNLDAMTARWNEGREHAKSRGYDASELNELEDYMQTRGIMNHDDAMRLAPIQPKQFVFGGLPADEIKMLFDGNEDEFLRVATRRALRGQ